MLDNSVFLELLHNYYAVWQECNYVYGEWAKAHGLSINSLFVLSAIHEGGESCTQKKISQRWMIPKQTVNMILKDFQKKGLVELLPLQKDKRNKQICFTQAGADYANTIITKLRKAELYAVEKVGAKGMGQLNDNTALFVEFFIQAGKEDKNEPKI